jgi:hypothetical protein
MLPCVKVTAAGDLDRRPKPHTYRASALSVATQFIRHKTEEGKLEIILNSLLDYVKQIYLLISHVLFPSMN